MTLDEVSKRVEAIRKCWVVDQDEEKCHASEDHLYEEVLTSIVCGDCVDPKALAALALETKRLDFPRWCA